MKIKIFTILEALPHLAILHRPEIKEKFKFQTIYNFSKTIRQCFDEAQAYEKIRVSRLEILADKDENGAAIKKEDGSYKLTEENLKIFKDEVVSIVDQEVEIYCSPISIAELGAIFEELKEEEAKKAKKTKKEEKEAGKEFKVSDIKLEEFFAKLDWLFTE